MTSAAPSFGPVADYLPHRPPMLLIDDIVEVTADRAICSTTIHPECVFAIEGRVHPSAIVLNGRYHTRFMLRMQIHTKVIGQTHPSPAQ